MYVAMVDQWGRIKLPQPILKALGLRPEAEVTVQVSEEAIIIKPRKAETPITATIAAMNLPVAEWETIEREIEAGRVS